jgi:hypothetical protein
MKAHHVIRHGLDFSLLCLIMIFGLGGLVYYRFDTAAQIACVLLMSALYVIWGAIHHFHDGNLTGKIVLEYVIIATLVSFILIVFLLRV